MYLCLLEDLVPLKDGGVGMSDLSLLGDNWLTFA
jgi:hypothetical protein